MKRASMRSSDARSRAACTAARGEVDAGDGGAHPRPGERVEAEVTLEVEESLAGDVSDFRELDGEEAAPARTEGRHVIEGGGYVEGHDLVPVRAVGFDMVVALRHFLDSWLLDLTRTRYMVPNL